MERLQPSRIYEISAPPWRSSGNDAFLVIRKLAPTVRQLCLNVADFINSII